MNPTFLVLASLSPNTERAAHYAAALGAPLPARLALLHLYHDPLLDPELVTVTTAGAYRSQAAVAADLRALAAHLPVPATVTVSVQGLSEAVREAVGRTAPLLLAMGLSTEHDALDHLLHNQALPALRATHRPLLLVPEAAPAPRVPGRVVVAIDAEPFRPNAAARALAPLLAAWQAAYTVAHITAPGERQAYPGQRALGQLRMSGLLPPTTPLELYEEHNLPPAAGILQALDETRADLLVLIARPRSFLGRLFHRSITAKVLRHSRVPVLLLPVEAPEIPDWMPSLG